MKQFSGYKETQTFKNAPKLPAGAYVLKIQNIKYESFTWGDALAVAFDIEEGEQKGFFKKQYEASTDENKKWKGVARVSVPKDDGTEDDNKTKRAFKTFIESVEQSNSGYSWDWDENKLKGKLFGGLFGEINSVINGKQISWVGYRYPASAIDVREGRCKIPQPQFKNGASANNNTSSNNDFLSVPESVEEEIPF